MTAQEPTLRGEPAFGTAPNPSFNSPNTATSTAEAAAIAFPEASEATGGPPPEEKRSPFTALQHRDFRLFWAGGFISQVGSQMRVVALGVQIWDLTHDFRAVSLLGIFRLAPLLVLFMFGGVIADALDRRRLLILTQSTLAISSVLLAVATQFGWISAPLMYGVSALGAAALAFDNPARSALTPNLVPRHHLPNALSLNIIVWQIATIIGPMLGGQFLPMGQMGFAVIYWFDAISFTATIVALILIRTRTQKAETRDVSLSAAFEGFRFLRRAPIILSTMTLDFFATFFGAAMLLLPAFTEQVLKIPRDQQVLGIVSAWGLLYAAPAIGAVVAGLIMSWLGNVRHQGIIVLASVSAYGVATVFFGASTALWLTFFALAGTGAADTVSMVMRQTIRQLSTPDDLRGRMTSINMIFYMGGPQLGEFEAGMAAQILGLAPSLMLGGVGVLVAAAVIGVLVPSLRTYDRASTHQEVTT